MTISASSSEAESASEEDAVENGKVNSMGLSTIQSQ